MKRKWINTIRAVLDAYLDRLMNRVPEGSQVRRPVQLTTVRLGERRFEK